MIRFLAFSMLTHALRWILDKRLFKSHSIAIIRRPSASWKRFSSSRSQSLQVPHTHPSYANAVTGLELVSYIDTDGNNVANTLVIRGLVVVDYAEAQLALYVNDTSESVRLQHFVV